MGAHPPTMRLGLMPVQSGTLSTSHFTAVLGRCQLHQLGASDLGPHATSLIYQEPTLRLRELMLSPGYPAFPMKSRGGGTEIPIPRPLTQAHVEQMP